MENQDFYNQDEFENMVSPDVAEREFEAWCDANDIDCNVSTMNDQEKATYEKQKKLIIKNCVRGRLVFDGNKVEYTVSNFSEENIAGKKIKIGQITGRVIKQAQGQSGSEFQKMFLMLCALTGLEVGFFEKLAYSDIRVLTAIVSFLLAF